MLPTKEGLSKGRYSNPLRRHCMGLEAGHAAVRPRAKITHGVAE
jgi:hypothetical protein